MEVSKFFQKVEVDKGIYAIYNSLLMKIIFVEQEKYEDILKFNVSNEESMELCEAKIYVSDHEDEKLLQQRHKEKNALIGKIKTMYLCTTNLCNLRCSYCFINNQTNGQVTDNLMSEKIALISMKKFSSYLEKNNQQGKIIFYGGEPLINWKVIKRCIMEAKNRKYPIIFSIITNGTLLNEEIIDFFSAHKVNVGISIDGPREINDKNRKYAFDNISVYDNVFKKIELLKQKKCDFGLSITLSNEILDNRDTVFSWIKKLGIDNIAYNLLHYTWDYPFWKDYYEKATKFICESYMFLDNVVESTIQGKINCILNEQFSFCNCSAIGNRQIVVKPNGDLCICHGQFRDNNSTFSDIYQIEFEDIKKNKRLSNWNKFIPINNDNCLKCEALCLCGGGCTLQAQVLFGKNSTRDNAMCIFNKKILHFILVTIYKIMTRRGGEEDDKS